MYKLIHITMPTPLGWYPFYMSMHQEIDSTEGVIDAVEGGIDDYKQLAQTADGDDATAVLAEVVLDGDADAIPSTDDN